MDSDRPCSESGRTRHLAQSTTDLQGLAGKIVRSAEIELNLAPRNQEQPAWFVYLECIWLSTVQFQIISNLWILRNATSGAVGSEVFGFTGSRQTRIRLAIVELGLPHPDHVNAWWTHVWCDELPGAE